MDLSVIIPTHQRPEILLKCLEHLEHQTIREQIEVIVVSDGEDAKTRERVANVSWQMPVRYFEVAKSQQGVARNRGVREAQASTCLFIGDDIFLEPDACEHHVHLRAPDRAVLGFTTWDPAVGITDVMKWLEQSGWQFGYPMLAAYAGKEIPQYRQHQFTYTSHISLPTEIAKRHPFREDVSLYGWEDIEWGMRLCAAGVRLVYEPKAKALHHHHITMEQSLKRMETLGESLVKISTLVPAMNDLQPRGWKRMAYKIAAMLPTLTGVHRKAFLHGMRG